MEKNASNKNKAVRPPVVCILGHVDHGKSTLLDYIRKTNLVEREAGGITQHIGAYEAIAEKPDKTNIKITFIDTPGHEAFGAVRSRGASVADIAILVISAEDGVMPQTLDAYSCIVGAKIPFIVAITKIDKPNADIEKTKQSLAEKEIYLEGYCAGTNFSRSINQLRCVTSTKVYVLSISLVQIDQKHQFIVF
jgi:translation initiation factor IF-2